MVGQTQGSVVTLVLCICWSEDMDRARSMGTLPITAPTRTLANSSDM
jgi:hypothetical protein